MIKSIIIRAILIILALISANVLWNQNRLYALSLQRIDPVPEAQRLVEEKRYAEAADYLEFFLEFDYMQDNLTAQTLYQDISAERQRWLYQLGKVKEGLFSGQSDENIGRVVGVATDFLLIGDIRDLAQEGIHLAKGEEVDEVLVALASLGALASGAQLASGAASVSSAGAAAPSFVSATMAKSSLITLKALRKLGKMPKWLTHTLIDAAKKTKKTKSIDTLSSLLGDVSSLAKVRGGAELLAHTTDAQSLAAMARFSKQFERHAASIYRIGGDLAVKSSKHISPKNHALYKEAVSFGEKGIRIFDKVGADNFAKIALFTHAGKVFYKGAFPELIIDTLLNKLPRILLWLFIILGFFACLPNRRLYQRLKPHIQAKLKSHKIPFFH